LPEHARPGQTACELARQGLTELRQRHVVREENARIIVAATETPTIAYYAASIAHLLSHDDAGAA
jgi:hypothetical protein